MGFFAQENQPYPPSLSEFGSLRLGKKTDLTECLTRDMAEGNHPPNQFDAKVLDVAAIVHVLPSS